MDGWITMHNLKKLREQSQIILPKEKDKIYKCESCGKSFRQSNNLNIHIKRIHEGQRNYKCDSCGKSFPESGKLKKHIKTIHEGQRNYKCI